MPPRLSKRQIREKEELAALESKSAVEDVQDEETPKLQTGAASGSSFAALMSSITSEPEESEDEQMVTSKKKKKKKKKAATTPATPVTAPSVADEHEASSTQPAPTPKSLAKKKAAKKQQQKAKAAQKDASGLDDLDKTLAELSLKYPTLRQPTASGASTPSSSQTQLKSDLYNLLAVNLSNLDAEAEMRKFFGARVISSTKASSSNAPSGVKQRGGGFTRSNLTRPQPGWYPANMRDGLSLRALTNEELEERNKRHGWRLDLPGEKAWTVEYSKKYKSVTRSFVAMVLSGDPEGFWQTLRLFPYHADTLLQVAEVYYHREEHSTAADFISRALFTYERAFSGVGTFNFTSGVNRLDFDHVENRVFFLALHRHIVDLTRRGCVRTAFEVGKLLYGLDPATDPHGTLLHLDFLAIKTGQTGWLLNLWDAHSQLPSSYRLTVQALPNWHYSRALALYIQEDKKGDDKHEESTKALQEAVKTFPMVVPLLADKTDFVVADEVRRHRAFKLQLDARSISNETESIFHLISHIYVQRVAALWKTHASSSWFSSAVNSVLPSVSSTLPTLKTSPFSTTPTLRASIYRHVIALESPATRSLFSFIPSKVIAARHLACDPLPPQTKVTGYELTGPFFSGLSANDDPLGIRPRGRRANERMLERLVPDPEFRRQLQGFFEGNEQLRQQFPGGVVQFAQIVGQFPEVLDELMIAQLAQDGDGRIPVFGAGVGGMPGGMPEEDQDDIDLDVDVPAPRAVQPPAGPHEPREEHVVEDLEDEEEDEEEVAVAPLPVRMLRNVLNRFWGGGGATEQQDESSDEEEADDHSSAHADDVD